MYPVNNAEKDAAAIVIRDHAGHLRRLIEGSRQRKELVVLDLCCGKGGALSKMKDLAQRAGASRLVLVGVDFSTVSVAEANRRARERGNQASHLASYVAVGSAFELGGVRRAVAKELQKMKVADDFEGQFDVVWCGKALHYAFETETKARGAFSVVREALGDGGLFVGDMSNGDTLEHWYKETKDRVPPSKKITFGLSENTVLEAASHVTYAFRPETWTRHTFGREVNVQIVEKYYSADVDVRRRLMRQLHGADAAATLGFSGEMAWRFDCVEWCAGSDLLKELALAEGGLRPFEGTDSGLVPLDFPNMDVYRDHMGATYRDSLSVLLKTHKDMLAAWMVFSFVKGGGRGT